MNGLNPDTPAALDFLDHWMPGGPWTLTAIEPDTRAIDTRAFTDADTARRWIESWQGRRNIYFSVNLPKYLLAKKTTKNDIGRGVSLHVDLDPPDGANPSEVKPTLIERLQNYRQKPTVIIDSGGGVQGFWKLWEPTLIDGPESITRFEAFNRGIETVLGGDHCHNIDRIMRLPGTINLPDAKKRAKGRQVCLARVVETNWDREYDLSSFEPADELKPNGHDTSAGTKHRPNFGGGDKPGQDNTRSGKAFRLAQKMHRDGATFEQWREALRADPELASWCREKGDERQLRRTWDNAEPKTGSEADGLDAAITEFNARYAVVNENGKAIVYERVRDPMLGRSVLVRIQFSDLRKLYQNQSIAVPGAKGGTVLKPVADLWLSHPDRRTYLDGVVFDPTGRAPATCWNLWGGFAVEPEPGDWGLLRKHVSTVICAGNEAHFEYVLNWAARMFQRPAEPGEVALVIRGLKGAGKGIFLAALVTAWGAHGIHIRDAKHLIGNFNAHLRDCVCLFADEAFFAGDRQHEGALKGLVTERTLPIEGKGQNLVTALNMLHIMMASNSEWVVPASHDERRYAVFDVAPDKIGNRQYFAAIARQMDSGGLAAMIWELLHRDLSGFEVRDIPDSKALADQKKHSLDTLDRWWLAVLERGFVWRSKHGLDEFNKWHEFVSTEMLNRSYLQWCAENRVQRPMTQVQLGQRMSATYAPIRPRGDWIIGEVEAATRTETSSTGSTGFLAGDLIIRVDRPPGYTVGSLESAQTQFAKARGVTGEWHELPEAV